MTPPTEDERKAALAWLSNTEAMYAQQLPGSLGHSYLKHIRVLQEMLAEPRLPNDPPPELLERIRATLRDNGSYGGTAQMAWEVYRETWKWLTGPRTKPQWRVKRRSINGWVKFDSEGAAMETAADLLRHGEPGVEIEKIESPV